MKKVVFGIGLGLAAATILIFGWTYMREAMRESSNSNSQHAPMVAKKSDGKIVAEVVMGENGYEPAAITLKAGQAIKFMNTSTGDRWPASNIHPTHDLYPEFDPKKALKPGESWTFTFHKKGMWRMHDHLFPYMKGSVTVE